MKYDLFISYSRKDFEEVSALIEKIKAALPGISYWFDIDGIESGDEFEDKIISAIDNSSYVLFALSENSIGSQWTKDEVMYAKNTDKKVIPVLLKGAQMKGWFLFKFGRVDCIDSTNQLQMDKLLHNLATWTGQPIPEQKPAPVVETAPTQKIQSETLCPCGSGKLFKDCHGRSVALTPAPVVGPTPTLAPKPSEKTWKVGDYYNVGGKEGVVFWVDETGKHGKIVSMDQAELQWCTKDEYNKGLTGIATDSSNGMNNLRSIMKIAAWKDKYPAFAWCADHGDGWYLPAIDELKELLLNDEVHSKVNGTLEQKRGSVMYSKGSYKRYRSSTEEDKRCAWLVLMYGGSTSHYLRYLNYYVRAVSAF
ncbi:MAG: TIR domain-containing protein [Bacteroidales bacterium]|nr:TIR domain-containing protein [Bacteroidales bacterium]